MAKALVVVESPAKAKTINKYLGRDYRVDRVDGPHPRSAEEQAGRGRRQRLRRSSTNRSPRARRSSRSSRTRPRTRRTSTSRPTPTAKARRSAGTHPGARRARSGRFHRLTFNEITKKAIQEALKHPRAIDEKMVAAQRARRVLDRLVGYKISPLLWDKVRRGLSAGRVQSVALKLVCDREREIEAFVPEEYWNIFARLAGPQPPEFEAKLLKKGGDAIKVGNEEQSKAILADLEQRGVDRLVGHDQGAQAQRAAAVHHQQAAADGALPGQEDDDARAAAVRRAASRFPG